MESKTKGGVVRPKFVPKAQKATVVPVVAKDDVPPSNASNDKKNSAKSQRHNKNMRDNNSKNRHATSGRGSARPGPASMGESFFVGSNVSGGFTKVSTPQHSNSNSQTDNNSILASGANRIVVKQENSKSASNQELDVESASYWNNEDSGGDFVDDFIEKSCLGEEKIKTKREYIASVPVTLPMGTGTGHDSPLNPALFAACYENNDAYSKEDIESMKKAEELNDIFLIQLPSTLQLDTNPSRCENNNDVSEEHEVSPVNGCMVHTSTSLNESHVQMLKAGHVGKIQIMKSNKIVLVLNNKQRYIVSNLFASLRVSTLLAFRCEYKYSTAKAQDFTYVYVCLCRLIVD